jgi:tetratricopeptide (TPR) repeat protein
MKNRKTVLIAACCAILTACAPAYLMRGNAFFDNEKYDMAIREFDKALRIRPNYAEALQNRARAYYQKGDIDRAIEDYTAVLRIWPDDFTALANRGVAYYQKGDIDRAIEDYDAALGTNYKKSDIGKDVVDFPNVLIRNPKLVTLVNRGIAYCEKGDFDKAIEDFDAALGVYSGYRFANALYYRGEAHYMKGEYELAIVDWETVLQMRAEVSPFGTRWARLNDYFTRARRGIELARQEQEGQEGNE